MTVCIFVDRHVLGLEHVPVQIILDTMECLLGHDFVHQVINDTIDDDWSNLSLHRVGIQSWFLPIGVIGMKFPFLGEHLHAHHATMAVNVLVLDEKSIAVQVWEIKVLQPMLEPFPARFNP